MLSLLASTLVVGHAESSEGSLNDAQVFFSNGMLNSKSDGGMGAYQLSEHLPAANSQQF